MQVNDTNNDIIRLEKAVKEIKSYNTSIITVGYATFFAILLYLNDKLENPLIKWSLIFIMISASIFVLFELVNQIISVLLIRNATKDTKLYLRYWAFFFIPSVLFAFGGIIMAFIILVSSL